MINFREYIIKSETLSYYGFREIREEELRAIFSRNNGYAKLIGGIDCCLGDGEEFFILESNRMMGRICSSVKDIHEGENWITRKLYFLNFSDAMSFICNSGRVYSEIPSGIYTEIMYQATRKPLTLLVKEDAELL